MSRQAFFRPVVIDSTNDELTVTIGGVGPTLISIPNGAWSCWATVLEWIRFELVSGFSADAVAGFLSDGRVAFADQGGQFITIAWTTPQLGYSLGFTAGVGPATSVTSTYSVDHAWFPPYQFIDQERFSLVQKDAFSGSKAKDGTLAGTSTGPDVFQRTFTYEHVPAELSVREGAIKSGAAQEWHAERTFENLIKLSRTAMAPDAGMPSVKGFYYVQEFSDCGHLTFALDAPLTDAQPDLPETMGSGGICFDLDATPDWYVFGFPGEAGASAPRASVPRARVWYECGFEMTTAPAPSWDDADLPARMYFMLRNDQTPEALTTIYVACPGGGNAVTIHWGDGNSDAVTCDGTLQTLTHDYNAVGSGRGYYNIYLEGDYDELTQWRSYSQAYLSGDLSVFTPMVDLTRLTISTTGFYGDVSALAGLTALTVLQLHLTSVTGTIASFAAMVSLDWLYINDTALTGDIAVCAAMLSLDELYAQSTGVTGDLSSLAPCTSLNFTYLHTTAIDYTGPSVLPDWTGNDIRCYSCGWTTAQVDNCLIDIDSTAVGAGVLSIAGTNAGRTNPGAGENARLSLVGKGWTVTVN
jgi:hypothetical protein